jgi:hypothetical protein
MIRINSLLFLLAVLFSVTSCYDNHDGGIFNCRKGEGSNITKELYISDFTGVKLDIDADIYITQDSVYSVLITGQENIINKLERDVNNGIWEVKYDGCVKDYHDLSIHITMPVIDYLSISGSGTIYGENAFDVDEIGLKISGSGSMDLALYALKIDAKISGSGEMKLSGATDNAEFSVSGSGEYHAFDLLANKVEVNISGSGDADVYASEYLDVEITGSGDVYYKGNPSLDVRITGSGSVYNSN